jgi:outer membrane protein OmpA-like peptidoglycan-associated protein
VTGVRTATLLFGAAALALAGCAAEISHEIDEGGFGNPTMNNTLYMTGQRSYVQALGERFAREVTDTVNFDFDSAVLDAQAQAILRRQADWIRQFPEVRFRVYGHTDLVGSDAYNRALGLRRAQAVVSYLATQGISRSRLEAVVSFGRTRPVIQTADPERRNRRTVTEVTGFVQRHPTVLNGKYAEVIFREYIRGEAGATFRHPANVTVESQTGPGN